MKTFRIFALAMFFGTTAMAQSWELGTDLSLAQPTGGMTRTMTNAFGATLNFSRNFKAPFSLGAEVGFGTYGSQKSRQRYTFDDGTVTETDVVVSNDIFNFGITGRYFLRPGKLIDPYLTGRVGIAVFSTTLTIEDPEDEFSCHPLESDVLSKDHTYTASGGAGVRIDFSSIFRKMDAERFYFDLHVMTTQGGNIRYMNAEMDHAQTMPDRDVTAKFINTQTQVIHEHHVGYVYTSLVNMVEYRFGVVCQLGWQ
jgi:opacity protein-like surface antigen